MLASLQLYYDHTSPVIISHLYHYHLLNLNSMLKILQVRLRQYMNHELPGVQAGLEKAEEPEIKLPREFQKNICFIGYTKAFDPNKLWKILKEMRIPNHLTCLLRNLYTGQEATVRTGDGTTDWFQIWKYIKAVYYHPAYLTSVQSTSC